MHLTKRITIHTIIDFFVFFSFKSTDRVNKEHLILKARFKKAQAHLDIMISEILKTDCNAETSFTKKVKKNWTIEYC